VGRCGESNDKSGSVSVGIVVAENLSTVLLHDAIADAKTKSGSLADFLGGEEGIEDAVGLGDALAVVAEGDFDSIAGFRAHDFDAGGATDFMDCVVGVVQNVEKDLLKLVGIAINVGKSFVEVLDNIDAVAVEIVGSQLNGTADNLVQLHGVALRRHLAREAQQILDDGFGEDLCGQFLEFPDSPGEGRRIRGWRLKDY
jgi:hypothetical protein